MTVCTYENECLFGAVVDGQMILNDFGRVVEREWTKSQEIRAEIELDVFQVMPNHFHGIIRINQIDANVGAHCDVPLRQKEQFGKSTKNSVPTIIKLFKASVTKRINIIRGEPGHPVWQRNYYEHVIRNENELDRIREYIINNPFNWQDEKDNPENLIKL